MRPDSLSPLSREQRVAALTGAVIVSCQAGPESPLNSPQIIAALALSAEMGGASGFRVDGPKNVAAVRAKSPLPIIGINKVDRAGFEVRITATSDDAFAVVNAGADFVAVDGTQRERPFGQTLADIVTALHRADVVVMADISTSEEARYSMDCGVDIVATTLAGYTPHTDHYDRSEPAFSLLADITALPVPVFVEGRIWSPEHVSRCFALGAKAVIIGSAITVPQFITRRFVAAAESARVS
ncbi:MAG: N-acetylmannosamine-6-phosphate 2-epimerase [Microbacteriaceae bacterium]|nr:N-acetylmannosamine-6-phosphate 2-epimerase [Microbacteriaceae bacterium]